ncbi:MAG: helicase-related protein [Syntrophus sp. (in: bacteria)]
MKIIISEFIRICAVGLPPAFIADLKRALIFENPAYLRGLRYGSHRMDVSPFLFNIWQDGNDLILVRGFTRSLINLCHRHRLAFEIEDRTQFLPQGKFSFSGTLYGYQHEAVKELEKRRFSVLTGPMGCGKRVTALYMATHYKQPVLIVVATRRQIHLWRGLIRRFLGLPDSEIGQVGGGMKRFGDKITVAVVPGIYSAMEEATARTGFLILDRADTVNINVFRKAVLPFNTPYMLGLANNPKRTDGLTKLMFSYLGEMAHEIKLPGKFEGMGVARPRLIARRTAFQYLYREDFGAMIKALCSDEARNSLIMADVLQETADARVRALILSERIDHLQVIKTLIAQAQGRECEIINSDMTEKQRKKILEDYNKQPGILLTTYLTVRSISLQGVTRLFIASPVKNEESISHAVSALIADGSGTEGEQTRIFDYRDTNIHVLNASFQKRRKFYHSMGVIVADVSQEQT